MNPKTKSALYLFRAYDAMKLERERSEALDDFSSAQACDKILEPMKDAIVRVVHDGRFSSEEISEIRNAFTESAKKGELEWYRPHQEKAFVTMMSDVAAWREQNKEAENFVNETVKKSSKI